MQHKNTKIANLYMTKDKHRVKVKEKKIKEKESKTVRKKRVQRDVFKGACWVNLP